MPLRFPASTLALALAFVIGAVSFAPAASAEANEAAKKAARELGLEGARLYDQGKYAEALDRLERAYAVIPAPTLGLWSAQALVKLGRLVEASERLMEVQRMELGADASSAFKDAQAAAEREYAELQPRIPHVEIALEGATPDGCEISIDDQALPSSLVGAPAPVDPGRRTVVARRGDATVEETIELQEGESRRVVLRLPPVAGASSTAEPLTSEGSSEADASSGTGRRTLGWIGIGVGGAGLVFGGVTRGLAMSKRDDLGPDCVGNTCAPERANDVDTFNRLRIMSDVGLIAGGILAASGVVLVLTAPSGDGQARRVEAWVGLGRAGVKGAF